MQSGKLRRHQCGMWEHIFLSSGIKAQSLFPTVSFPPNSKFISCWTTLPSVHAESLSLQRIDLKSSRLHPRNIFLWAEVKIGRNQETIRADRICILTMDHNELAVCNDKLSKFTAWLLTALVQCQRSDKATVHHLLSTKCQGDTVLNYQVSIMEHLTHFLSVDQNRARR